MGDVHSQLETKGARPGREEQGWGRGKEEEGVVSGLKATGQRKGRLAKKQASY